MYCKTRDKRRCDMEEEDTDSDESDDASTSDDCSSSSQVFSSPPRHGRQSRKRVLRQRKDSRIPEDSDSDDAADVWCHTSTTNTPADSSKVFSSPPRPFRVRARLPLAASDKVKTVTTVSDNELNASKAVPTISANARSRACIPCRVNSTACQPTTPGFTAVNAKCKQCAEKNLDCYFEVSKAPRKSVPAAPALLSKSGSPRIAAETPILPGPHPTWSKISAPAQILLAPSEPVAASPVLLPSSSVNEAATAAAPNLLPRLAGCGAATSDYSMAQPSSSENAAACLLDNDVNSHESPPERSSRSTLDNSFLGLQTPSLSRTSDTICSHNMEASPEVSSYTAPPHLVAPGTLRPPSPVSPTMTPEISRPSSPLSVQGDLFQDYLKMLEDPCGPSPSAAADPADTQAANVSRPEHLEASAQSEAHSTEVQIQEHNASPSKNCPSLHAGNGVPCVQALSYDTPATSPPEIPGKDDASSMIVEVQEFDVSTAAAGGRSTAPDLVANVQTQPNNAAPKASTSVHRRSSSHTLPNKTSPTETRAGSDTQRVASNAGTQTDNTAPADPPARTDYSQTSSGSRRNGAQVIDNFRRSRALPSVQPVNGSHPQQHNIYSHPASRRQDMNIVPLESLQRGPGDLPDLSDPIEQLIAYTHHMQPAWNNMVTRVTEARDATKANKRELADFMRTSNDATRIQLSALAEFENSHRREIKDNRETFASKIEDEKRQRAALSDAFAERFRRIEEAQRATQLNVDVLANAIKELTGGFEIIGVEVQALKRRLEGEEGEAGEKKFDGAAQKRRKISEGST